EKVPVRQTHNRLFKGEFGTTFYIVDTPVSTDTTLVLGFPRLIKCFHQKVIVLLLFSLVEKTSQKQRLIGGACNSCLTCSATGRPAYFTNQNFLLRKCRLALFHFVDNVVDSCINMNSSPISKHVYRNKVDVIYQFWIAQPDMPGFSCTDRLLYSGTDSIKIDRELFNVEFSTKNIFVTDDDTGDIGVVIG